MSEQQIRKFPELCAVEMSDGKPCGRTVHPQRAAEDPGYVCVMHSHDYGKDQGAFDAELNSIMDGSSTHNRVKNKWDFQGFVFLKSNFANRLVSSLYTTVEINFARATFKRHAAFSNSSFDCDIDFTDARFERVSSFEQTRFAQRVRFWRASFAGNANFNWASFARGAEYSLASFGGEAAFARTTFSDNAIFRYVNFAGPASFSDSNFMQGADFMGVTFDGSAEFYRVVFSRVADFRSTAFRKPAQVVFHRINNADQSHSLGMRARLVGCLLENIRFEDVNWTRRNGRIYLEDEADLCSVASGLVEASQDGDGAAAVLTHELVADAYRRLVNNFEKSRQYVWAEECFLGEMEMRRRNPRHFFFARFDWARNVYAQHSWARRLGETISFTNFYRKLSNYGSSYLRALWVLVGFLILFAFLLPAYGLRMPADSKTQASCSVGIPGTLQATEISWRCALSHPHWARELAHTFNAGFWDAFEVAVFQKNRTIEPTTTGGRRLEIFENIVIPGQFALVLLAIRRRFRR
jgi:hypothetical protein